jgi:uncharacterized damage-inducible protein DinB
MELQPFETIEKFVQLTKDLDEPDLEKPWAWHSYDGEGVRFAFFRTYEELQELAVKLELERVNLGYPLTSAQRILGQYHVAFRSLEAVLLAVDSEIEEVPPAEGEWSIRETLAHILRADIGFYIVIRHALDRFRAGDLRPEEISDEVAERILGLDEKAYNSLLEGSYENLRRFHTEHHQRILDDFGGISEQELEVGSKYWEDEEMSLRFRLHRFDSHMRQHTIQVEKALSDLDHAPNEINRLHRMIYCALAGCENKLIGSPVVGEALRNELIKTIHTRVEEIAALV